MKPKIDDKNFEKQTQQEITKKNHVSFMKMILKEHKDYVAFMTDAFLSETHNGIFTIRATYRRKKGLWREIEILGLQSLEDLALMIVESMDWAHDHCHGFWLPDKRHCRMYGDYGIFDEGIEDDPHPKFKTHNVSISHIDWKRFPVLGFVFDFGDGHEFDITCKGIREVLPSEKHRQLPRLVDQRGVAPEQYPDEDGDQSQGENDDFLFDDCDICVAQKNTIAAGGNLNEEVLIKLFQDANTKNRGKK